LQENFTDGINDKIAAFGLSPVSGLLQAKKGQTGVWPKFLETWRVFTQSCSFDRTGTSGRSMCVFWGVQRGNELTCVKASVFFISLQYFELRRQKLTSVNARGAHFI